MRDDGRLKRVLWIVGLFVENGGIEVVGSSRIDS